MLVMPTTSEAVDTDLLAIGQRIRRARERLALTQADVAQAMRIKTQAYQRFEKGKLSIKAIKQLAPILEVSADYLLYADKEIGEHPGRKDVPPDRRRVLWLMDNGMIVEAVQAVTEAPQSSNSS